jgi:(1->4)-alpha-D-glucan 1-alpha-D-glucosylmutase
MLAEIEPWLAAAAVDATCNDPLAAGVRTMLDQWEEGRIKLFVTACAARLRRARPGLFLHGAYEPLGAAGPRADHLVSCLRRHDTGIVVAVATRLSARLTSMQPLPVGAEIWAGTRIGLPPDLSARVFRNLLTGERVEPSVDGENAWIEAGDALRICPVALLWGD